MKKERHILQQDWEDLRIDIEKILSSYFIDSKKFRQLGIHEDWKKIEENIYHTFCKLDHPTKRPLWLWEDFKLDTFSIANEQWYKFISKLVDDNETVWFFVNGDKDKFWFYEGKIEAIMTVIKESIYIDEFYLASKKYLWLICLNHHNTLITTGDTMPDRLRLLQATLQNS